MTDPSSIGDDYDPCTGGKCEHVKERPNLALAAVVYVVFGIKDIDRSNVSYKHVLTDKASIEIKKNSKSKICHSSYSPTCKTCHSSYSPTCTKADVSC